MEKQIRADMMLLFVTICWGISYFMMDASLKDLEPFNLNAIRFLGAFIVAAAISFPKLKNVKKSTIKYSIYIGAALYFVYIGATYGVLYTSLSNVGFLCALTVVFTPILDFIFKKKIPSKKLGIVILMCIVGIGLLTLTNQLKLALGDLLAIMCAIAYAVDMVITETAVSKDDVDAYQIGVFQLLFCGILCLITTFAVETPHFPGSSEVWIYVIFLSIFCTGLAFIIQAVAQQYTSASHVGVIFTLEPVFAGVVAFFLAGEILSVRAYIGAGIMIAGLFIMEIDFKKLFKRKKEIQ